MPKTKRGHHRTKRRTPPRPSAQNNPEYYRLRHKKSDRMKNYKPDEPLSNPVLSNHD